MTLENRTGEFPNVVTDKSATAFRVHRFQHFLRLVEAIDFRSDPLKILDIGGTEEYWQGKIGLIERPVEITLVNIERRKTSSPQFVSVLGDARSMPQFGNNSFDVVHSNSVIEHVGLWYEMSAMANEIRRVASSYFVQTPYYWFPVEPHARTPFLHWLPQSLQLRLVMARKLGPFWSKGETVDQGMRTIHAAVLLDKKMFSALFPDGKIISEKFFGLTKSLIAIRYPNRARDN